MYHKPFETKRCDLGVRGPILRQLNALSPDDKYERCFVIFAFGGSQLSLFEVPNTHPKPEANFRIHLNDYLRVKRLTRRLDIGFLHTHPGRDRDTWIPSDNDMVHARTVDKQHDYAVYHPYTRRFTWYGAFSGLKSYVVPAQLTPQWRRSRVYRT